MNAISRRRSVPCARPVSPKARTTSAASTPSWGSSHRDLLRVLGTGLAVPRDDARVRRDAAAGEADRRTVRRVVERAWTRADLEGALLGRADPERRLLDPGRGARRG